MEHALSYVIYVMPLVWFIDWVTSGFPWSPFILKPLSSLRCSMVSDWRQSWCHWFRGYVFLLLPGFYGHDIAWFVSDVTTWLWIGTGFHGKDWALFWRGIVPHPKATTRVSVATIEWMSVLLTTKFGLWVTPQLVLYVHVTVYRNKFLYNKTNQMH
jgi:hypothetical protein